ncbi:MAG: hypothetical protein IPP55_02100 [Anaerolineales bacterium]|nr:hypothetical protein [Anaerolineales bacterium]
MMISACGGVAPVGAPDAVVTEAAEPVSEPALEALPSGDGPTGSDR